MADRNIKIRYIKSHDFRAPFTTGVYGGITSNGLINANFFTDRVIIPKSQIVEIDEKGAQVGQPLDEKDGDIAREVTNGVLMDINTAHVVLNWLQSKIEEHKKIFSQTK